MPQSLRHTAGPRHYARAPITEALIDIRVEHSHEAKSLLSVLKQLGVLVQDTHPQIRNQLNVVGQLTAGNTIAASATQSQIGYAFLSEDGKRVFQATTNGYTYNWLAPYDRWESLRDEAQRTWQYYRDAVRPTRITRLATRYINRIDIPIDTLGNPHGLRLEEFLNIYPQTPLDDTWSIDNFVMQVQLKHPGVDSTITINESTAKPPTENIFSIMLDIDVFTSTRNDFSEDNLWEQLGVLRNRKNEAFEASITDRTRSLIA